MKLLDFPLIKITLCLIVGIVLAHFNNFASHYTILLLIFCFIGLIICLILERNRLEKSFGFDILAVITFVGIGVLTYQLHNQKEHKQHYTQHSLSQQEDSRTISFQIKEVLKPSTYYDKYIVEIFKVDGRDVSGKTLLNVAKDSLIAPFKVDDIMTTISTFRNINKPLNPHQFDYGNYLEKRYIYHQISTTHSQLLLSASEAESIFGFAAELREKINSKLEFYQFKPDQRALINALLLGQRQDISPEIYDSYSRAGAIHILAVSGLHVGMILLLLNLLFKPVEYLKHGKLIKTILILSILWSFAVVAGLSASVTRAVAMFSVVAIGMNLKRPANIYNTLAVSIFFLLLFKPMFLFDVGFQMSYMAVISIVAYQPLFVRLYQPRFWPLKKLWQIFTVTLAAQLGVLPISLFYFHQFPGLFFLSNLVIIPFLGLILGMGIVIIIMALTNILPLWLAGLYGSSISAMNAFIKWIAVQEQFVITDISFSFLRMLSAYLLIIGIFLLLTKQNFKRIVIMMVTILIFQSVLIFERKERLTSELIVFHKSRYSLIGLKSNTLLTLSHNLEKDPSFHEPIIRNYMIGNYIEEIRNDTLQDLYAIRNQKLLVIDSFAIYQISHLSPDYILLRNSPKINLTRVLDSLKPKLVIADGSNYRTYGEHWQRSCKKRKIPFHWTSRDGAFVLKLTSD